MKSMKILQISSWILGYIEHSDKDLIEFLGNLNSIKPEKSLSKSDEVDESHIDYFYFNYPSLEIYWRK